MAQLQFDDPGQIAHATVVAAPDREESLRLAEQMAAALVCQSDGPVPCGVCRACRKAETGIHPDIVRIGRQEDDKGRLRREIVVNQVRAMASDAVILPNESPRKVYLIDEADTMNPAAQNAALKLLEEPPRGVYFLLCVTNPALLLPTVRSRCAEVNRFGGEAEMDPALQEQAEAFLHLTAQGDPAALLAWCVENESMDGRALAAFLDCAAACTAERIAGRAPAEGMSPQALMELYALLNRCRSWTRVNTGAKHILGFLAVEAIADEENRGVYH